MNQGIQALVIWLPPAPLAGDLGADRPAGKEVGAVSAHRRVDGLERGDLRRGEAAVVRFAAAPRQVGRGIEPARARIIDDAVLDAVGRVALRVHRIGEQAKLGGRDRRGGERALDGAVADHRSRKVEHRRAGDDAVEVVREALRLDQALPAAGRAAVEIRSPRGAAVVRLHQLLRREDRYVNGAKRVVGEFLRRRRKASERLARGVVAGVGLHRRETPRQGAARGAHATLRVERLTGVAAVAEHIESAVPDRRQADFESHLGLDEPGDAAILGRVGRCRHDCGGGHRELVTGRADQRRAGHGRLLLVAAGERRALPVAEL
jgi:hypothetical protein